MLQVVTAKFSLRHQNLKLPFLPVKIIPKHSDFVNDIWGDNLSCIYKKIA